MRSTALHNNLIYNSNYTNSKLFSEKLSQVYASDLSPEILRETFHLRSEAMSYSFSYFSPLHSRWHFLGRGKKKKKLSIISTENRNQCTFILT